MARLDVAPGDITALLVTHEHVDHVRGVEVLAHRYNIPVYGSHGTLKAMGYSLAAQRIDSHCNFTIGTVTVTPVAVPHDAREPTQFVLHAQGTKVGVLSDLGHVTPHVVHHYRDCDLLLMEANHDLEMLQSGRYPPPLKRRVGGQLGHLSNRQAVALLQAVGHARQRVIIGHVSEQNNSQALLEAAFATLRDSVASLVIADQADGIGWQTGALAPSPELALG